MYKDSLINYNPEPLNEAINESKKVSSSVDFGKYSSVSIPSGFKSAGILNSILSGLGTITTNIDNTKNFLSSVKTELDQYTADNTLSSDLLTSAGYFQTVVDGVEGYLYIPEGYTNTVGLPLITFLSGQGAMHDINAVGSKHGFAKLLSIGYKPDAVVWIPKGTIAGKWYNSPEKENTVNSIKTLINDYKLDSSKNVLMGYSLGAVGVFPMVEDQPQLFSSVVTFGGYPPNYKDESYEIMANSSATFILFAGTSDDSAYDRTKTAFKKFNNAGADVIMYDVKGLGHNEEEYIYTDKLITDLLNINKEKRYVQPHEGQVIEVSRNEFVESSIMDGKKGNADYYKSLVSDEEIMQNDSNDFEFKPIESSTDEPSTPIEPSTPAKPSTPIEPSTPVKPSTPIEPSTPAKPSTPIEPSTPAKPSTPIEPSTPAKPSTPIEPSTPAKPSTPIEPSTPVKPSTPIEPSTPAKPSTPIEPSTPVKPSTPIEPSTPVKPSTPIEPSTPAKPSTPIEPSTPVKPSTPIEPSTPAKPSTPIEPCTPVKPSTPIEPSTPAKPSTPIEPSTPVKPSTPIEPSTPSKLSTPVIKNVLPENRFSDDIPNLTKGTLKLMEVSNNGVSYDVLNVNNDIYNDYLIELEKQGYIVNENGMFTNGKYEIQVSLSEDDGLMNICLKNLE